MLWINLPVLMIMGLGMLCFGFGLVLLLPERFAIIAVVFAMVMSFILAWTYWSFMVPRWRIGSLKRVKNWDKLLFWSVNQLVWPQGHFFERTEIWTARQRQLAYELWMEREVEKGLVPPKS